MRPIISHIVNPANDRIAVTVLDEPGQGGANHVYRIDLEPVTSVTPAQVAYEAYAAHTGWKSLVSGADLPQWDALKQEIKEAWAASAQALHLYALEHTFISFQNGPISSYGVNGVTHESLLAIIIDRFEGFQQGPYACKFNAEVLAYLKNAQSAMLDRTRERMSRGVEGTNKV